MNKPAKVHDENSPGQQPVYSLVFRCLKSFHSFKLCFNKIVFFFLVVQERTISSFEPKMVCTLKYNFRFTFQTAEFDVVTSFSSIFWSFQWSIPSKNLWNTTIMELECIFWYILWLKLANERTQGSCCHCQCTQTRQVFFARFVNLATWWEFCIWSTDKSIVLFGYAYTPFWPISRFILKQLDLSASWTTSLNSPFGLRPHGLLTRSPFVLEV